MLLATDPLTAFSTGWAQLTVAIIIGGYVLVFVSWAWHRAHQDDVDQDALDSARRLRRELRGHDEEGGSWP